MIKRLGLSLFTILAAAPVATNAIAGQDTPPPPPPRVVQPVAAPAEAAPAPAPAPEVAAPAPAPAPEATPAPAPVVAPVPPIVALPPPPPPAAPSFKVDGGNGNTLKLGILLQPQFEAVSSPVSGVDGFTNNLYLRRTRILAGGTLFGTIDYFMELDYPNLFLADAAGAKATPGLNIQDAFATWKLVKDMVKVDVGYMLPALAHNALQGAGTLLSWDYFNNSFRHSNVFGSSGNPIGRDVGVQLRGLLLDGMIDYRLGLFQGKREVSSDPTKVSGRNMFRAAGRVQVNLLDPETGYFYAGTYLGAKKILSLGGSFDIQDKYTYFAGDVFADMPVGNGDVVTAQVNVAHWDGDTWVAMPKQTAVMGEAGYRIGSLQLSPIVRVEYRDGSGTLANQTRISGGLAYWAYGHTSNLKLFYTNTKDKGASKSANQINLQWQLFVF